MVIWDGQIKYHGIFAAQHDDILERLVRICRPIPQEAELGFHLCYGDWDAKHFVEPQDAARMVSLTTPRGAVQHPISYIHMPVPIGRDDEAYFTPFNTLKVSRGHSDLSRARA